VIVLRDDTDSEVDSSRSRNVLEESVYLNLLRVHHVLQDNLSGFFEEFDLTPRQYNVLRILYVRGQDGLPCRTIRERLVTKVSDISRLIDRLVEKGLVNRERSDEDRRVVLIHLTGSGEEKCQTVDENLIDYLKNQFDHMTEVKIETLNDLLKEVLDRPVPTE
jgi:DNA-binding MarR family transcriptional regulator